MTTQAGGSAERGGVAEAWTGVPLDVASEEVCSQLIGRFDG